MELRIQGTNHADLPEYRNAPQKMASQFRKGRKSTSQQLESMAKCFDISHSHDQRLLCDTTRCRFIISQGRFPRLAAEYSYSSLPKNQVVPFSIDVPLPDIPELHVKPETTATLKGVCIFDQHGNLKHIHLFVMHGSSCCYPGGKDVTRFGSAICLVMEGSNRPGMRLYCRRISE